MSCYFCRIKIRTEQVSTINRKLEKNISHQIFLFFKKKKKKNNLKIKKKKTKNFYFSSNYTTYCNWLNGLLFFWLIHFTNDDSSISASRVDKVSTQSEKFGINFQLLFFIKLFEIVKRFQSFLENGVEFINFLVIIFFIRFFIFS